jgi:ABC-type multidrug transport system ATPase subunit
MDEVTANIDYHTDRLIQNTIRTCPSLCNSTIITVAHRLRSIADSDIIVYIGSPSNDMDSDGNRDSNNDDSNNNKIKKASTILEIGTPYDLLIKQYSLFKSLSKHTNEFDEILSIAKSHRSSVIVDH